MAAFLNLAALRAHAVPVFDVGILGAIGAIPTCRPLPRRPRLTADWVVMPDGKLACCWREASADADPLPD
jgi:hypothetical protein